MKVNKKASTKAIEFAQKIIDSKQLDNESVQFAGKTLGKSTSWEDVFYIVMSGFCMDIKVGCERTTNCTEIIIYKGDDNDKANIVEKMALPLTETFDEKEMDLEWNFIYKYVTEWLMKNRKKLLKGTKKSKKQIEPQMKFDDLLKEVCTLREEIKSATGKEKKKLIDRYNGLSKILNEQMEANKAQVAAAREAKKASEDELEELRKRKQQLYNKIRNDGAKGKPVDDLKKELEQVTSRLREAKVGVKTN